MLLRDYVPPSGLGFIGGDSMIECPWCGESELLYQSHPGVITCPDCNDSFEGVLPSENVTPPEEVATEDAQIPW